MTQTYSHMMRGGMDLVTPAIAAVPGRVIGGLNYDPEVSGYRRTFGYERYDGQPRPSDASYWVLNFDAGTAAITEGQTVTGATSGATGKALIDAVITSGSYVGTDAAGYLVLTIVSGTFVDDEDLQVSAATKSVADGAATERGALTDANDVLWLADAIATARALIAAVPGSGAVRGVFVLGGSTYAIRNNAGGTAGVLHKQSTSGWAAQSLGSYLLFDAGTTEFTEGETVTGGTSGATGVVRRYALLSGAWDATGTGILTLSGITGTFQNNEALAGSLTGVATADGVVVANALPAGGHYDFVIHNFYGVGKSPRAYGCQGQGRAFEWDGTYFTPILTDLTAALDKPTHISQFKNHLFLGYSTGYAQNSEIGEPLEWTTAGGAFDYSFGSEITNFSKGESTALLILGRNNIGYVIGNDSSDFVLEPISSDAGAVEWTYVTAGFPTYMDDAGIRRLETTQAFGNWRAGTLTALIEPFFHDKQRLGVTAAAALRIRKHDQYKLFFSDGTGLTLYLGQKKPETIPFELDHTAFCSCEGVIGTEPSESVFIGTTDGYVMELDQGNSFDGEEVLAWLRLAFNHLGAPSQRKRFHKVTLECDAGPALSLGLVGEFSHGTPYQPAARENTLTINAGGGVWDDSLWNDFAWSAQLVGEASAYVNGIGFNAAFTIISETAVEAPHILKSMTIHFAPRGLRK